MDNIQAQAKIKIELHKPFVVSTPDGLISDTGVRELTYYMLDHGLGNLPDTFEPVWITNRGTLPKRLASHIYKTHAIRLTPEQVSEIGNIARRHTSKAQDYVLDFTNSIDWEAGDFGDSGSCYWGDKAGAKQMIEENGYAVRAYRYRNCPDKARATLDYYNLTGYARAWIAKARDNCLILFNGYGETSLTLARVLALHYGLSYKRIDLTNEGTESGVLWINGSQSYMIGSLQAIEGMTSYNLNWEEIEAEPEYECENCGCTLEEDDRVDAYDRRGNQLSVCSDCYFTCDRCQENYLDTLANSLDGDYYCNECHNIVTEEREEQERLDKEEQEKEELESEVV